MKILRLLSLCCLGVMLSGVSSFGQNDLNWGEMNAQKGKQAVDTSVKRLKGTDETRVGKPGETEEGREKRLGWWRASRFGMFIHWGLYSEIAGIWHGNRIRGAEWIQSTGRIPTKDYAMVARRFKADKFNADEWVSLAKAAGMKYIIITAKHHDGFAMWDSKASNYNIVKMTPFGRDPLKELAEACKKQGVKLGFYYSQNLDWENPYARGNEWEFKRDGADFPRYMKEKCLPQMKELLTNYGELCAFWFDFPLFASQEEADTFVNLCWKLQPQIILNDRAGGKSGDFCTPEQSIPGDKANSDLEACMTLNDNWGFCAYDHDWKPTYNLVRNLVNTTSKNGNFLLNVGPDSHGEIPKECVERLKEVGKWLQVNGDSIYGTEGSPFGAMPWGRLTQKRGKLFLHVFEWPGDGNLEVPLASKIKGAKILSAPNDQVGIQYGKGYLTLTGLPKAMPDKMDTVIELELAEPIKTGVFRGQRLMCPDFEDDYPEGWSTFKREDFVSGEEALQGNRSMVIRYDPWMGEGWRQFYQVVHVNGGDRVDVSALVKMVNCDQTGGMLEIEFHDKNGKELFAKKTPHAKGNDAAPRTIGLRGVVAPQGTETATVKVTLQKLVDGGVAHDQSMYIDNVTLRCTPYDPNAMPTAINGDFETLDFSDWDVMGDNWTVEDGKATISWEKGDDAGWGVIQQAISVEPGQKVKLDAVAWAKDASNIKGRIEMEFNNASNDGMQLQKSIEIKDNEGPVNLSIPETVVPEGAVRVLIKAAAVKDGTVARDQKLQFDNFKLKITPAPATAAAKKKS